VEKGEWVEAADDVGARLGTFEVVRVLDRRSQQGTRLVQLRATPDTAARIAGIRLGPASDPQPVEPFGTAIPDQVIVCRCEHVTAGEVRHAIRSGVDDVNELKAMLRVCMGACCGKNCPEHIARLYREEGVAAGEVTPATLRPLFLEVPLGTLAAGSREST
jgi:sarcosine oxidase, subunit alpha